MQKKKKKKKKKYKKIIYYGTIFVILAVHDLYLYNSLDVRDWNGSKMLIQLLVQRHGFICVIAGLGGSVGYASDCDQEVADSIPAGSGYILSWKLSI